jgi:tetratricopeptide (TPR) repeat protein
LAVLSQFIGLLGKEYPSLLAALGVITGAGWVIEQYYGYKSHREVLRNRPFQGLVVLVVLATAGYHAWDSIQRRPPEMSPVQDKVNVLILPFENLTGHDSLREGMALSLTDSFLNTNNVNAYNERARLNRLLAERGLDEGYGMSDILALGKLVRADFVLWGTVQQYEGSRYQATVRIIEIAKRSLVRPTIDETSDDVFRLQRVVFQRVVSLFDAGLTDAQRERGVAVLTATSNLEAYDYYVKGRNAFILTTPEGYAAAIDAYREAIRIDPDYALAWAGLASAYVYWGFERSWNNQTYQEYYEQALDAAQTAARLNPSLSETHRALALVYAYWLPPRREEAEREANAALAINPDDYEAYFAIAKARGGDEEYLLKAIAINEDYLLAYNWLTTTVYVPENRVDEAIEASKKILAINPEHALTFGNLADLYLRKGMSSDALAMATEAIRLKPDLQFAYTLGGEAQFLARSYADARKSLLRAVELNSEDALANFVLARAHEELQERDEAVRQWYRFLSIRNVPDEDRAFARQRLAQLEPVVKSSIP